MEMGTLPCWSSGVRLSSMSGYVTLFSSTHYSRVQLSDNMAISQNMVSSLPFLAPICMRKARDYRSKNSSGRYTSSSDSRKRGFRGGDGYKLNDLSSDKSLFASNAASTASQVAPNDDSPGVMENAQAREKSEGPRDPVSVV